MSEQTPFTLACAERGWDTPTAFLRAFHATGELISEPATLTDRQLRRWRQPDPPAPRLRAWRVLNAMFGISPTVLGFRTPPGGETIAPVDRRSFFTNTLGTASSLALGATGAIGTAHLLELREGLRSLYTLDDAYGGGDVRSLAVRHLRRIRRVINTGTYPDSIGRQLQLLAGETAEHCGWLYYDADEQDHARRYWGDALTTATMLRDDGLEVLILAGLSLQAIHEDRPRDALDLARAAHQRAAPMGSPTLLSLLAAREARALARMRDRRGADRVLADAMRLIERASRGRPAPEWTAFHGPAELDFVQGMLNTEAGHHKTAVPFLRAALTHQDRTYGRNRALYRLTLARGLAQAGEVDEAAAEATGSLEHLAEVESGRVARRLLEVRDLLAGTGTSTARDAVGQLNEYAAG
jgi:hypothetical protein